MGVSNQHKDYKRMIGKWQRCLDVCAGQEAIHAAGPTYLPKLGEQTQPEYDAYKLRATFYNATWRTVVGLQGMLFRKPPKEEVPEIVKPMLENVTLTGTPLHVFALELSEECLKLGRVGVLIDYPTVSDTATLADADRLNLRPSMRMCKAPSIINWKTRTIENKTVLSMIVLQEIKDVRVDDFEDADQIQYRVLDLTPIVLADGSIKTVYRVRVFIEKEKGNIKEDVLIEGPYYPKINGVNLEEIPFQFIGVDDVSWNVDEPPLIDLVDVNLAHYRTVADYEHGCHFTGLPTPVISGYNIDDSKQEKFNIGSMTAWVFPNANAKAAYLEFTGQGLQCLEGNLTKKEGYMAILGARMLEVQVRGVESANTAAIHRGGEQSMLASVGQSISIGFTKALKLFCDFAGADSKDVKFDLNKDFFPVPMDALTVTALIAGWQNSAYSYDTLHANLKAGEIIPLDSTPESELASIKKNPPPMLAAPTTPGNVKAEKKAPKAEKTPATLAPTQTQLQNRSKK